MSNINNDKCNVKNRTETQAFKFSEELMDILYDKETGFYKPWQFIDYKLNVDTLKTTYDEIVLLGKQEAMIRPGWKVGQNEVFVPNIFSKVKGVHNDIKLYKQEISSLIDEENILFIKKFPVNKIKYPKNSDRIYSKLLNSKGKLDKNKLLTSDYWRYKNLNPKIQERLAEKIIEFCDLKDFWKHKNYKIKLKYSLINRIYHFIMNLLNQDLTDEECMQVSIFCILINLNNNLINLLQVFDYPLKVPKVVIYNNNKGKIFSFEDAVVLMFLNSMGVDIIMYNPCGASDIENYVAEGHYDIHMLEDINPDLPFRRGIFF